MYRIRLEKRAESGLRRIRHGNPKGYLRIVEAIRALAADPRPSSAAKLKGFRPPAWRIRVGEYRVVYEISDEQVMVLVINVAPRGEIYK